MDPTKWLAFMTRTDGPRWAYLLRAFLLTIAGTFAAAAFVVAFLSEPPGEAGTDEAPPFGGFVILWPAVSTVALWGVLELLKRIAPTYWHAAAGAMLVFAGLFTLAAGVQAGLIFAWAYFMFALTFLAWQLKSPLEGFVMAFLLQVLVNLVPALFLFPASV